MRRITLKEFEVGLRTAKIALRLETDSRICVFYKEVILPPHPNTRQTTIILIQAFKELLEEIDESTRA